MIYLSRLILNPRSKQVRNELADPYEMHRTLMKAFPEVSIEKGQTSGILFRVELPRTGIPSLLVQSQNRPAWEEIASSKNYLIEESYLPFGSKNPAEKTVDYAQMIRAGQQLAFRLRANPTRRFSESRKRVGLYREEDQMAWLRRKFEQESAATLISVRISDEKDVRGKLFLESDRNRRMRFHAVQFDGFLQVKEKSRFLEMLVSGIGSGKGMGFGLLSVAPAASQGI